MEHWQLILCGYFLAVVIVALCFLIKVILTGKKNTVKKDANEQRFRLFMRFVQILAIIFAIMAVHFSYLCGDINLCCPVITVLALLFIMASLRI